MSESYQTIAGRWVAGTPRVPLSALPTPLERASRLEQALRDEGSRVVPRVYLKRDDLLSVGMGGNKLRNLEFLLGAALEAGATDVVTAGRVQSNHCRLTAAACARVGLKAHIVLSGARPEVETGNLVLDRLFGARVYFTYSDDRALRARWLELVASGIEMTEARRAFVIPVGGSDAVGALGHALLAAELLEQLQVRGETLAHVVLATATGGTQAGLLSGLRALGSGAGVHGVAVARSADELAMTVQELAAAVDLRTGGHVRTGDVQVDGAMLGGGYGVATAAGGEAMSMLARTEGVVGDPVYTAKGLAGLLSRVRRGAFAADDAVVFLHTGGAPALFAGHPDE